MTDQFIGKAVVVTGGASGIGQSASIMFAAGGASVTVADIDLAKAEMVAEEIVRSGGKAIAVRADTTKSDSIAEMVRRTVAEFGRLDIAFNNAGVPGGYHNVVDCTEDEWDHVQNCNVRGVWLCMKYEIPEMLKVGGGAIVNTSSGAGMIAPPAMAAYVTSKHAVIGLTRSAAIDFGPRNIRVNAICPGMTWTPMLDENIEAVDADTSAMMQGVALRRFGEPKEQAAAAVWLCSDNASYITGAALTVDGGLTIA